MYFVKHYVITYQCSSRLNNDHLHSNLSHANHTHLMCAQTYASDNNRSQKHGFNLLKVTKEGFSWKTRRKVNNFSKVYCTFHVFIRDTHGKYTKNLVNFRVIFKGMNNDICHCRSFTTPMQYIHTNTLSACNTDIACSQCNMSTQSRSITAGHWHLLGDCRKPSLNTEGCLGLRDV